ncbi:MAG: hypothetical protein KatS3mg118_3423 [Paracoccaceae bacterium]|nr:MAG: hypothetical protein KatS3mg118_3423 [Paracoccaceae bacterium]
MTRLPFAALLALAAGLATPSAADEFAPRLRALYQERVAEILADPVIIAALRAANEAHAGLSQAEIDSLDRAWRDEVSAAHRPTIDPVLSNPASDRLRAVRDAAEGLFTEIFVMDNRGLNVAASDVTSDYWQGDEAKWQQTFAIGPGGIHISDVELDESSQTYQAQLSVAITDPDTGAAIGAATFGVNVEYLD